MLWVAAAGPAANLVMGIGWAMLLKFAVAAPENLYSEPMFAMARVGISINGVLMLLNLLPLPPLDGGRIVTSLLPPRAAWQFAQLERWGLPILVALLFLGALDVVLRPLLTLYFSLLSSLFGF
jgi:Zn-dependent protease